MQPLLLLRLRRFVLGRERSKLLCNAATTTTATRQLFSFLSRYNKLIFQRFCFSPYFHLGVAAKDILPLKGVCIGNPSLHALHVTQVPGHYSDQADSSTIDLGDIQGLGRKKVWDVLRNCRYF